MQLVSILELILRNVGVFIILVIITMVAWNLWVTYINTLYLKSIEWIVLEIVPPKEVFKSPAAMELVLNVLHGGGAGNWYEKYWKGELAQYYSLEIVSTEGKVHFYIRFAKKFKKAFEAQLYAQYPQAEVREVEDYTKDMPEYTKDGPINLFAYSLKLAKEDPYPIKSYIDYGLDRAVGSLDEQQRIDPITPLIETMGSIGIGEHIWVQIILRQDTKRHETKTKKDGVEVVEKYKSWKDKSTEIIEGLKKKSDIKSEDGKVIPGRLTRGEQEVIESIVRHRNKPGFDCAIRTMYIANKENFSGNTITAYTAMFRQFNSEDLNSFKMDNLTKVSEPWKDIKLMSGGSKVVDKKKGYLSAYKNRSFFYGGFSFGSIGSYFTNPEKSGEDGFILSTEELATLYHLPGRVVETPSFSRIESKKAEPPSNLPI